MIEGASAKARAAEWSESVTARYRGASVVVTGAAGFLATSLVNRLQHEQCEIVRVARPGHSLAPLDGAARMRDVRGDIRDRHIWDAVLSGADVVFHFAAQTSASAADGRPAADLEDNVLPMVHLLEACREGRAQPVVVFASTVTVAGIPATLPLDETHLDGPLTIYDLNKLAAEQYLKSYVRRDVVRGAVLRLPNVYGPGPASARPDRGVLNRMIQRGLRNETLTVYLPANRLRDYVFVDDVADAFLRIPHHIAAVNGTHVLVGTGHGHSLGAAMELVADRVARKTGVRPPVEYVMPPTVQSPIEARDCVVDASRLHRATGWCPTVMLAEGIDRTIEACA